MTSLGLNTDEVRGHLAMLGFSALVAGSFSLGVIVANDIAPQAITAARFILATIVMGMVAALQRDLKPEYLSRPWRYFVLGGLFVLLLLFGAVLGVLTNQLARREWCAAGRPKPRIVELSSLPSVDGGGGKGNGGGAASAGAGVAGRPQA